MIYIENEGALFRGPARAWPKEVWNGEEFTPYKGIVPKDMEWGHVISEEEAQRLMGVGRESVGSEARFVENEGALFRIVGPSNAFPDEIWSPAQGKFIPYEGVVPKPVSWGQEIPESEALAIIGDSRSRNCD